MRTETVRLVLDVDKSKYQAFLDMLKLFDFVRVESNDAFLERFLKNAPKDVPVSDDEVAEIVTSLRYGH